MLLGEPCQAHNLIGDNRLVRTVVRRACHAFPVRTTLRHLLAARRPPPPRLGTPSRYEAGDWVRVLDEARVRETLDGNDALRGLTFVQQQWRYCGETFRVLARVQRILDDRGGLRAVGRTVALDGTSCVGNDGTGGCGRECPLWFRDEWLEPAEAPPVLAAGPAAGTWVRVRAREEIAATLDGRGRTGPLLFMPEMLRFAGQRLRLLRRIERVWELERAAVVRDPVYLLDGAHCTGTILGASGPCDRACRLLWHERWLRLDVDNG